MTLRLHAAAAREVRQFQPARPGRALLYARGTTVQGLPYLGQLRLAVSVDILIRWLEASGYRVTYCRNVTDLDEGVLDAAGAEGSPWWVLAERARRHHAQAAAELACRPPDVDPRTAGQASEMITCFGPAFDIQAECADAATSDTTPERGRYCLRVGPVRSIRSRSARSRSARSTPARSASEAVGYARPAEMRYFLAQAHYQAAIEYSSELMEEAAAGYQEIERFAARAHRMLRGPGGNQARVARDWNPPAAVPGAALLGLGGESLILRRDIPISFAAAMDDDLDVAAALKAVHATVHDGNYAIKSGDQDAVAASLAQLRSMLAVLGLDPLDPHWATSDPSDRLHRADRLHSVIDELVALALRQQEAARARGDYAVAGSIRDALETMGVEVEDTAAGPRWELKR